MDIAQIISLILGGTTITGFYIAWHTRKSQVQIAESNALQELQKAYREFVIDQTKEYTELKGKIEKLEAELLIYKTRCESCNRNNS